MSVLEIVSILIAVAGLCGTFYFGIKTSRLKKKLNTIDWHKAELGIDHLSKVIKSKFDPDLILSMSVPGRIVADLFLLKTLDILPHYTVFPTKNEPTFQELLPNHFLLETSKRQVAIPKSMLKHKSKKLLVIDSASVTGDTLERIVQLLEEKGFPRKNIFTATLIVTDAVIDAEKGPDEYCYQMRDHKYILPWGNYTRPWY